MTDQTKLDQWKALAEAAHKRMVSFGYIQAHKQALQDGTYTPSPNAVEDLAGHIHTKNLAFSEQEVASILALIAEVERLREALKSFAGEASQYDPDEGDDEDSAWGSRFTIGDLRRARAALEAK